MKPREAGWDFTGFDYVQVHYPNEADMSMNDLCGEGSGCTASDRGGDRLESILRVLDAGPETDTLDIEFL